jgi:hypothetical protein
MHALVPDARLILLLRNPVARAISHYGHQVQRGVEHRPAAEALMSPDPPAKGKPNHYKRRGLYADQIEQVLGFYPREQLLVLRSEDFFAQPTAAYGRVQAFLGLSPQPLPPLSPVENVGRARAPIPAEVREHLRSFYREPNQRLQALLPEFPIWNDET